MVAESCRWPTKDHSSAVAGHCGLAAPANFLKHQLSANSGFRVAHNGLGHRGSVPLGHHSQYIIGMSACPAKIKPRKLWRLTFCKNWTPVCDNNIIICSSLSVACRHPDHSKRPTFTKLVQSLSQPEEVLLKWASEDSNVHYQVRESH